MNSLASEFLLDPEVVFLNHGSFGACPRQVFETYQRWQRLLEYQPVKFLSRDYLDHMRSARGQLASFVGADPSDLAYIPNATFGVNVVARSLELKEGDQVLLTNHEYGACENVWRFLSTKLGFQLLRVEIPLPLPSQENIVEMIWKEVKPRTKIIFLSQITSPTAGQLPAAQICTRAREVGILTMVDGAHVPGQLDLDVGEIGADFYSGNCHKWLLAPKGAAFLHVQPERQERIDPLVVSWGWGDHSPFHGDSRFLDLLEWWGTKDPSAYLTVPEAIAFQRMHRWEEVRIDCQKMLRDLLAEIQTLTGLPPLYSAPAEADLQMAAAEIPASWKPEGLQTWLYKRHRIEIPVILWEERWLIRPSVQGYNSWEDLDLLLAALREYRDQV